MPTIIHPDGREERIEYSQPNSSLKQIKKLPPLQSTIDAIVDYMKVAFDDASRFQDVMEGYFSTYDAETMKRVAQQFTDGNKPKTKTAAKQQLIRFFAQSQAKRVARLKQLGS